MNKQELIGKIRALPYEEGVAVDTLKINRDGLIKLIEQFDEPQKVKIPDFVAEWIEYCKAHDFTLFGCIDPANDFEDLADETFKGDIRKCIRWCRRESNIFARAWLDGYTVEKEKRYLVKAKGVYFNTCLIFEKENKKWLFSSIFEINHQRIHHTHKELEEAGFGEVFNSPLFELEEVEEMIPKYRAWDKIYKKMYEVDEIHWACGKFDFIGDAITFYRGAEEVELMQSTGLFDKNGKEVFVGDIIKCTRGCLHEVYIEKEYGGTYIGGMPAIYLKGIREGYAWTGDEKIIGNIYENPELLEVTE